MKKDKPASENEIRFVYQHCRIDKATGDLQAYPTGDKPDWIPAERGGATVCIVLRGDKVLGRGVSGCSKLDPFCYRIGRAIARGRALRDAGLLEGVRLERKQRKAEAKAIKAAKQQVQGEGDER